MNTEESDRLSDAEAAKRRDEALKRALGMPHKPHKDEPKREKKKAPEKTPGLDG